jgi:hypothetical protein
MAGLKVIKPKGKAIDAERIIAGVRKAMDEAKEGAIKDFQSTTSTWNHKVAFTATATRDGYDVGTSDEIYGYVDQGTRPHVIVGHGGPLVFQSGYKAKTSPRVIGSSGGGATGAVVFTRMVQHPGTAAREFTETILAKWQTDLPLLINEAIGGAVGRD